MYTTPCDAAMTLSGGTCTGASSVITWNNGGGNNTTTGYTSTVTGRANTQGLVNLSDAGSPYNAAAYCAGLSTGGHNDWYLPAQDELLLLYTNRAAIGGFLGPHYWSSTEYDDQFARGYRFTDGALVVLQKPIANGQINVRCVRR